MKVELGQVVAERRLRLLGHPDVEVWVRLGQPRPFPDDPNKNYYCPYQIAGIGDARVRYAGGVDSLQALELALHILPTELDRLRQQHAALGWEDAPEGDYGFSKAVSTFREDEAPRGSHD
jgi:Domain of unknown function (DUF6968)